MSSDPQQNPNFHNANHVFVPYCTSDAWSGTRRASQRTVSFMGSYVLREVIRELADYEQLQMAEELFLTGSSAGAVGVLVNVDDIASLLAPSGVRTMGIIDSGWFLDNDPFSSHCADPMGQCSIIQNLKQAVHLWGANVPKSCRDEYPDETWKCFLGYKVFPLIECK